MLKYRFSIVVALLIIAIVAAWYFYYKLQSQPAPDQTLREQFSWQLSPAPASGAGPYTVVGLKIADVSVPVGTYAGSCDDPLTFLPGEISGVICKADGRGTEVGIFMENGRLVLEEAAIDPQSGRGVNFQPIKKQ